MSTYPKIETLFERNDNFTVDTTRLRRPEFGLINSWVVTEKIDGTNVRLMFHREGGEFNYSIRGRSDNASFHPDLLKALEGTVLGCKANVRQIMEEHGLSDYVLYGEGYGAKIQNGGRYRQNPGFILFDIKADSSWLDVGQVNQTANILHLLRVPMLSRITTIDEIVEEVRSGINSVTAEDPSLLAEGVVAKTLVPLYNRRGERVIWKLKTKDFGPGRR